MGTALGLCRFAQPSPAMRIATNRPRHHLLSGNNSSRLRAHAS
jgi:hypothetical protein